MKLQGGLDMTLDQDYNVAIWSAFYPRARGGGLPHRAKPKLIYAMSVLPLGSYLASNNAAQYLAKAPAEQSSAELLQATETPPPMAKREVLYPLRLVYYKLCL